MPKHSRASGRAPQSRGRVAFSDQPISRLDIMAELLEELFGSTVLAQYGFERQLERDCQHEGEKQRIAVGARRSRSDVDVGHVREIESTEHEPLRREAGVICRARVLTSAFHGHSRLAFLRVYTKVYTVVAASACFYWSERRD